MSFPLRIINCLREVWSPVQPPAPLEAFDAGWFCMGMLVPLVFWLVCLSHAPVPTFSHLLTLDLDQEWMPPSQGLVHCLTEHESPPWIWCAQGTNAAFAFVIYSSFCITQPCGCVRRPLRWFKKYGQWAWRVGLVVKSTYCFSGSVPSTHMRRVTTGCNASCQGASGPASPS